ncbi:IS21 family transposase [Streptomyces sp. NPDC094048]|uniref:IS21 family transposase n=1 Tax=Streptomyces sp. NPDC094048 TaxID=3155207 RepID=UPI00332172E7
MKSDEGIMEILEAYDLTGSYRKAAELAGCDHHTVRRYVQLRGHGVDPTEPAARTKLIDEFLPKVEELVERSHGKIGADAVHKKIEAMGFGGTDRTTRRAVAAAKESYRFGHRRVYRPWIPEPGMWLQWDWGWGPKVDGRQTQLWCAWLAWSRFRVVIPVFDKTLPTIAACLDQTFRLVGGVPTYCLTDNEKTVTVKHIARIAIRNPEIVPIGRYYGTVVRTCLPADPESKGGSEATVRIAKRDLVPTAVNLREEYRDFQALLATCDAFMAEVNGRVHRETRRVPAEMLAEERQRLHPVPQHAFTVAFGQSRLVGKDATIQVDAVRYSVPHALIEQSVWARFHGDDLIVTAMIKGLPVEVARHTRSTPGNPRIDDAHYPEGARGERVPTPTTPAEAEFLALGPGAALWLQEAGETGVRQVSAKMTDAVALAKLHGIDTVDRALGTAATVERFADGDLMAILAHQVEHDDAEPTRPGEQHSLQPGTSAWSGFGSIG